MTLRRRVVTHRQVIPTILDRSGNGPLGSRKVRDFRYRPRTFMGESGWSPLPCSPAGPCWYL